MKQVSRILVLLAPMSLAAFASADYQLDINGGANNYIDSDLSLYSGGPNYSPAGTVLNIAGVSFTLAGYPGAGSDVGVVQSGDGRGASTYKYTGLSIAGSSNTVLYTLMNTAFGAFGDSEGTVDVYGTGGAHATLSLTEGGNIRDHFQDGFVNGLTDPTVVSTYFNSGAYSNDPNFGLDRLDRQKLALGGAFNGQTITEVDFNFDDSGSGQPFLAAATFHTSTPGPVAILPFALGLLRRRRSAKA